MAKKKEKKNQCNEAVNEQTSEKKIEWHTIHKVNEWFEMTFKINGPNNASIVRLLGLMEKNNHGLMEKILWLIAN